MQKMTTACPKIGILKNSAKAVLFSEPHFEDVSIITWGGLHSLSKIAKRSHVRDLVCKVYKRFVQESPIFPVKMHQQDQRASRAMNLERFGRSAEPIRKVEKLRLSTTQREDFTRGLYCGISQTGVTIRK